MNVCLFPSYVTIGSVEEGSPTISAHLKQKGIKLEECHWDGSLQSLPTKPSLIRASSMMKCGLQPLAMRCEELGHFCFSDDQVIGSDLNTIDALDKFLEKNGGSKMGAT